jgi:hypothetical protein
MATSVNIAAMGDLLKYVYNDKMVEALNNRFPYLQKFKQAPYKSGEGKTFVIPIQLTRGSAVSAIGDGATVPGYVAPATVQALVNVRYFAGTYVVTGPAMSAGSSSAKTVKSAMDFARDALENDIANRVSKNLMLDGTGILAQAGSSSVSGATLHLDGAAGYGTFYLEAGDYVAAVTTGGAYRGTYCVLSVNHTTNIVTFTTNVASPLYGSAAQDTDYLVFCQSTAATIGATDYNQCPAGLGFSGGMLDATATYENLDPATYPKWAPVVVAAGSVAINQDLMDSLFLDIQTRSGSVPRLWHANSGLVTDLRNLVEDNRRYMNLEVKTGTTGKITHTVLGQDCEFYLDRFVPAGQVSAIDEDCVYKFETRTPGFDDKYGGSVLKYDGADRATALWLWYVTWGTDKRWAHGRLTGLTQTKTVRPTLAG